MKPGSNLWLDRTPWWWGLNSAKGRNQTAEVWIKTLYLATLFQVSDDILEDQIRFVFEFVKRGQVLSILCKARLYRFVHKI